MGQKVDALVNHKNCLEIKEMVLEPECKELGLANRQLAEAYVAVMDFKEALPYGLKALQIHRDQLGDSSVEVVRDRRLLEVIYTGLEEYQRALEQNQLSLRVLNKWGPYVELLRAELDAANLQIALGNFDVAINFLKNIFLQTERESKTRALAFIAYGNALCNQEKISNSKKCLERARGILDKKESAMPIEVAEAYMKIARVYETMNEFEAAVTMLKRTLAIIEKFPQVQHLEGRASARLGLLLMGTGKVPQAILYLEKAVELLKESFGSKHLGVGYIYYKLGAANLELERTESASQMFAIAKEIMVSSKADAFENCEDLSKVYDGMGNPIPY
ncbi:hypothetical protein AQUCO_01600307v1 [Aquilegia coerulea]|uniref:MalT-like TPR region domain-containing protein n=1 Tax=Aquilegia coerulea TaxID=218851 RepID=A0A2G5DR17_AQUCA|nr:hypothetical protein AQUCO_01600307v1 [Aquilegia coerulea]